MGDKPKIFDDFPIVDCNECERYWINECDGNNLDTTRRCTSYKATRSVIIPLKIKRLETRITVLEILLILYGAAALVLFSYLLKGL